MVAPETTFERLILTITILMGLILVRWISCLFDEINIMLCFFVCVCMFFFCNFFLNANESNVFYIYIVCCRDE